MNVSLYSAASAMNANLRWQEIIAENLAASSVPGFKKQEMTVTGVQPGGQTAVNASGAAEPQFVLPCAVVSTDFSPGQFRYTGLNTDVGIDGPGFFEVQLPDGNVAYTRDGEFRLDGQGRLVTKQGFEVLGEGGPIQLDLALGGSLMESLSIAPGGEVAQAGELRGRLRVLEFNQPALLQPVGGGLFLAQQPGLTETGDPASTLRQRWLEQANTSPVTEMASLLTAMRAFEANQRVVQLQDERMGKVISELTPN
jgi:flagellar basal-body rod protein FlgF